MGEDWKEKEYNKKVKDAKIMFSALLAWIVFFGIYFIVLPVLNNSLNNWQIIIFPVFIESVFLLTFVNLWNTIFGKNGILESYNRWQWFEKSRS